MLGADGINLALMVADSGLIEAAANDLMGRSQIVMMTRNRGVKASVRKHLQRWQKDVKKRVGLLSRSEELKNEITLYQTTVLLTEEAFLSQIDEIIHELEESGFYSHAKKLHQKYVTTGNPLFPHLFCDQWYEYLLKEVEKAQCEELKEHKDKVLKELYERIEALKTMDGITSLGDEEQVGRLWDMSSARLSKGDSHTIKQLSQFLSKHDSLREIAEKLGRMASETNDPSLNQAPNERIETTEEKSEQATDDIVGIHENNDLNKLLPSETIYLSDPELEVIFYKNLVDRRLLNYRMQGKTRTLRKVKAQAPDNKEANIEKGPFVVCVDASGSMSGFPEQCAKAMAFALMQIALTENRDCYVMLFSTEHITYDLTQHNGLKEAADFLSYTFHGGTDFTPVIEECIQLMHGEKYKNADLVVVSDFMAPKQPEDMIDKISALKKKQNRFHAINLSQYGNPQLLDMFDFCWSYHPTMVGRLVKNWQS
ncbi:ATPase RavA stimulator ViaA [Vibrio sp.]|nr:ATPase RavA stimulator ViaA [Vibrio sp.]